MRAGKQPESVASGTIHPGGGVAERLPRPSRIQSLLRYGKGAPARQDLHAHAVCAVQQSALRQGVPGRRDLAGAGRHSRHRLRLVHWDTCLHGGLPVCCATLQLGRSGHSERRNQHRHPLPGQSAQRARRGGEMHQLHPEVAKRPQPGVRGGLSYRREGVRQLTRSHQ